MIRRPNRYCNRTRRKIADELFHFITQPSGWVFFYLVFATTFSVN